MEGVCNEELEIEAREFGLEVGVEDQRPVCRCFAAGGEEGGMLTVEARLGSREVVVECLRRHLFFYSVAGVRRM